MICKNCVAPMRLSTRDRLDRLALSVAICVNHTKCETALVLAR